MGNLTRLRQISAVIARHGLDHYMDARRRRRRPPAGGRPNDGQVAAMAGRFRALLEELGPTFIKFGQVLSTRPDLLPRPFIEALVDLQDHCQPMSAAEAEAAVVGGLGRPLAELFADFSAQPVASASIAQVHRARLHSGEPVAVKVQRPHIRARIGQDIDILSVLARLAEAIIEESGIMTPRGVVDQFEQALMREVDFTHEAAMTRRFRKNLKGGRRPYVVPTIYADLSCETVLTMSFVEGEKIAALGPTRDRASIAHNIVLAAFDQLFVDGLFHADPHPGNWFVLPDDRLALIDFGATGTLSFAMREALVVLVLSIGTRDADATARLLYRQGVTEERVSLHKLRDACASLFDRALRDAESFAQIAPSELLLELFEIAARFRLRLPSEYALVTRASLTIEGIIRQLDPELTVLTRAKPLMRRLIEERFSLPTLQDSTLKNLLRARDLVRDLPMTASQILMDLEGGRVRVQVEIGKLEQIARNIDTLGVVVSTGLVAGGLVTGSMFILARYEWAVFGLPVVPIVGLYIASMLFGGVLGRLLLAPRLRKVSLARWLARRRRGAARERG